jgi:hypothetical protein
MAWQCRRCGQYNVGDRCPRCGRSPSGYPTMPQFWAGFVGDKIDKREVDTGFGGYGEGHTRVPMLFTNRTNARKEYVDVRKVEIRIVSKKRKK